MFRPVHPLAVLTNYTVTIKKNIKDINGNGLAEDRTWSFTTGTINDTVPPRVLFSNPLSNSITAPINTAITVNFSEPVDPASVTTSTLTVSGPGGPVAGTVNVSGITATFTPAANFSYLTTYTITASQGIKDLAGNPLSAVYVSNFTTSAEPDTTPPSVTSTRPSASASGVSLSAPITITFSEPIEPTSATTGTVVVSCDGASVSGTVVTDQNVVTFTPSSSLSPLKTYSVLAKTGIRDLAGNALAAEYAFSFTTATVSFSQGVVLATNDIIYNPFNGKLYASVPGRAGAMGNSVTVIDPVNAVIQQSVFVGSEPTKLALSDDGRYIYVAIDGAAAVVRVDLLNPSQPVKDIQFTLGSDSFLGPMYAEDLAVLPGNSHAVAVSRKFKGVSPRHAGVAVYDDGVMRPNTTPTHTGSNAIEFSASAATLYGYNNETTEFGFRRMAIDASGVTVTDVTTNLISSFGADIIFSGGLIFGTTGQVIDPQGATPVLTGTFSGIPFGSLMRPDSQAGRTFFLTQGDTASQLQAYSNSTFVKLGTLDITGISGTPGSLVRWGTNGFAFRTDGDQVFIFTSNLVP